MKIISVIPISKGISVETLSYFSGDEVTAGSIVQVPLRKKNVSAIVVEAKDAAQMKSQIRSAGFELKKIGSRSVRHFLRPELVSAAVQSASYFAASTGSVLNTVLPSAILENIEKLAPKDQGIPSAATEARSAASPTPEHAPLLEQYVLQADDEERFAHYKSLIRESFAKKKSVYFCLPTVQDIETALAELEKGIEKYTCVLNSTLTEKELVERCKKMLAEKHPVLIIATCSFLCLPRMDIGTIIIEKENSKGYKVLSRPYLDFRTFTEYFAKNIKAKLIVGDLFLQTETMFRYKAGEFQELYRPKFRSLSTAKSELVDMRTDAQRAEADGGADSDDVKKIHAENNAPKKFTIIGDELAALIEKNKNDSELLFIFAGRKGLSPTTVCADCGAVVLCTTCHNPTVLHGAAPQQHQQNPQQPSTNFFLCHTCGERRRAEELCKTCGSWRLVPLGIGIERVAEEIKKISPDAKIFVFDRDTVKTRKKGLSIINEFYSSPGSILLGTEMALPYLDKPIDNGAISSVDAFFSIPDFKIPERVLGIILKIRAICERRVLLQTRMPDQPVFKHGIDGNIVDFYRDEILIRKTFNYPPFSILIKLSLEGEREKIAAMMAEAGTQLSPHEFDVFPSYIKGRRGKSILHGLLKVPRKDWPNEALLEKLLSLSPQFSINVDPDSLL